MKKECKQRNKLRMEEARAPSSSCLTGSADGRRAAVSAAAPAGTASAGLVQSLKQACLDPTGSSWWTRVRQRHCERRS